MVAEERMLCYSTKFNFINKFRRRNTECHHIAKPLTVVRNCNTTIKLC